MTSRAGPLGGQWQSLCKIFVAVVKLSGFVCVGAKTLPDGQSDHFVSSEISLLMQSLYKCLYHVFGQQIMTALRLEYYWAVWPQSTARQKGQSTRLNKAEVILDRLSSPQTVPLSLTLDEGSARLPPSKRPPTVHARLLLCPGAADNTGRF